MNILINISKCLHMQILFQYQSENKMCWKTCLGRCKHICKLFSCVEVRERSENSQFLLYLSMAFKNRHISQNLILRSKIPSLFNLFLQSLQGVNPKSLLNFIKSTFLIYHQVAGGSTLWNATQTPPYRKLSCKGALRPRPEFSTPDADSDTAPV